MDFNDDKSISSNDTINSNNFQFNVDNHNHYYSNYDKFYNSDEESCEWDIELKKQYEGSEEYHSKSQNAVWKLNLFGNNENFQIQLLSEKEIQNENIKNVKYTCSFIFKFFINEKEKFNSISNEYQIKLIRSSVETRYRTIKIHLIDKKYINKTIIVHVKANIRKQYLINYEVCKLRNKICFENNNLILKKKIMNGKLMKVKLMNGKIKLEILIMIVVILHLKVILLILEILNGN